MRQNISSEKKLQLIQRIREEHRQNRAVIQGREDFLYGKGVPYEVFDCTENKREAAGTSYPVSTLKIRAAAALLLFAVFYMLTGSGRTVFGIGAKQVYQAVETDYSPILFDFMEEIPYTLHE